MRGMQAVCSAMKDLVAHFCQEDRGEGPKIRDDQSCLKKRPNGCINIERTSLHVGPRDNNNYTLKERQPR